MHLNVKLGFLFLVFTVLLGCSIRDGKDDGKENLVKKVDFDSVLSKKLGADEYGMKQYVMAFLKAGPNRTQDSIGAAKIQKMHLENINRMAEEGKLVLAGPFLDDGEIRGIYLFNVRTLEEARRLTATDPAVKAGRLVMELHPWYGSAALLEINNIHKRIEKRIVLFSIY
ncbi:MAG: YciI family protein [Marinifilaceae bacterium]